MINVLFIAIKLAMF